MSWLARYAALTLVALWAPVGVHAQAQSTADGVPATDHHMHVRSPEASRISKLMCEKLGPVKCPPLTSKEASAGADALAALDQAGISQGVLLSLGYIYGSPNYADLGLDVAKETRMENSFVVDQARLSCGRLLAFVSVDPLSPNAFDEVAYWGRLGGASGLKLHMGNSSVDLRSAVDLQHLRAVFAAADRARLPIIIHLESRADDFGAQDVQALLKEVLPAAPHVPVQIAHAGGGGGVTAHTLNALRAFADGIDRDPKGTRHLLFDLAMVPDAMSNTEKLRAAPNDVTTLKALMHRIGMERFVMASDWTAGLNLKPYFEAERNALGLEDSEWRALAANQAPYMATSPRPRTCAECVVCPPFLTLPT